jgi:hypothetical protein
MRRNLFTKCIVKYVKSNERRRSGKMAYTDCLA